MASADNVIRRGKRSPAPVVFMDRTASWSAGGSAAPSPAAAPSLSADSELAAAIGALVVEGDRETARHRFGELVTHQQRRALRIAYHYLRDVHDADEAVQDAFVKAFTHIERYRREYPFEVWFTRILVNGCLDMRKARARRLRWVLPASPAADAARTDPVSPDPSPEQRLMSSDRAREIASAVAQLPDRQRTVFTLCQIAGQHASEVSRALGLSEATVRVHLFRAVHRLRRLLERHR